MVAMEAGEILLRRGLLNTQQLETARSSGGDGSRLVELAVEKGFVSEEDALRAIGDEVGLDFVDLPQADPDLTLLKIFPHRLIHRQGLFPIRRTIEPFVRRIGKSP